MPEALLSWAHSFHDFCPIGVALAIVWLIGTAGYRKYASKRDALLENEVRVRRRRPF